MKNLILALAILFLCASFAFSQDLVVYNGEDTPDGMYIWPWGFLEEPVSVPGIGYTPGTSAIRWIT